MSLQLAESVPTQATTLSGLSALFSLSQAAASAAPIPVSDTMSFGDVSHGKHAHALKHRRLSSTGQMRRRLSDARDAAVAASTHPHAAASALASLSLNGNLQHQTRSHTRSLSNANSNGLALATGIGVGVLSAKLMSEPISVPISVMAIHGPGGPLSSSVPNPDFDSAMGIMDDIEVDVEDDDSVSVVGSTTGTNAKSGKGGRVKKRGTIFKCESCSKVYRHPSCLVKHRWEHSPHWREASKFLLSKHQQVQLLEAAAILSHLDPGSSLPDDRSLWPSYLSGGLLPPPTTATPPSASTLATAKSTDGSATLRHTVSSSVPSRSNMGLRARSGSVSTTVSVSTSAGGPRMHDYKVAGGITQIRPGLLAQPTSQSGVVTTSAPSAGVLAPLTPYASEEMKSQESAFSLNSNTKPLPMAVPMSNNRSNLDYRGFGNHYRDAENSSAAFSITSSSFSTSANTSSLARGGWSLPKSDVRSDSVSRSYSESRSGSRSDDEDDYEEDGRVAELEVDVEVDVEDGSASGSSSRPHHGAYEDFDKFGFSNGDSYQGAWKKDDEDDEIEFREGFVNRRFKDHERERDERLMREEEDWETMAVDMDF